MDAAVSYEWELIDAQFIFDVGVRKREKRKREVSANGEPNATAGIRFQCPLWNEDETTDGRSERLSAGARAKERTW